MNHRVLIYTSAAACVASLAFVMARQHQIAALRAQQQGLATQSNQTPDAPSETSSGRTATSAVESSPVHVPSLELLRLRATVTRLEDGKRELAEVRNENDRLRAQLATSRTNARQVTGLPPGYLLRSNAKCVGYNTPEDTIQSLLWAVQNRDFTNLLQAFTPEKAKQLQKQLERSGGTPEDVFKQSVALAGMRVVRRQPGSDPNSIVLQVEIVPGMPAESMVFRQVNGQWKLEPR